MRAGTAAMVNISIETHSQEYNVYCGVIRQMPAALDPTGTRGKHSPSPHLAQHFCLHPWHTSQSLPFDYQLEMVCTSKPLELLLQLLGLLSPCPR